MKGTVKIILGMIIFTLNLIIFLLFTDSFVNDMTNFFIWSSFLLLGFILLFSGALE